MSMIPDNIIKISEILRPAIQADGGDLVLHSFDPETGTLEIELVGSCTDCGLVGATMSEGLQRIYAERTDNVKNVINIGDTNPESTWTPGTSVSLN